MKKVILFVLLALVALCLLLPIWIAVTGTFSATWELKENLRPVLADGTGFARWTALPRSPTLRSLVQVLLDSPSFFPMFWNSVAIAVGTLLGQFLFAVPAGWALAKLHLPGEKQLGGLYGLLEVQGIENLDLIPVLLQRMAAGNHDVPFGIGDNEAGGIGF